MHSNIYAYTATQHPFPEYVSLNRESDGRITITVRGPAKRVQTHARETQGLHDTSGETVTASMTEKQLQELREALMADAKARHP